jgi:hypothetical protein
MHVECGVVSIDFVQENFCIVIVRQQDFELQGSRLIFQAAGFVRHQQREELIPPPWRHFNCSDGRKFLACPLSLAAVPPSRNKAAGRPLTAQ